MMDARRIVAAQIITRRRARLLARDFGGACARAKHRSLCWRSVELEKAQRELFGER